MSKYVKESDHRGHAASSLLAPEDVALLMIDHQGQMVFGVQSIDRQLLVSNATALAKTAKVFGIPTVLTTVSAKEFSGPILPQIRAVFPEHEVYDRSTLNAWEDDRFRAAVERTGRRRLIAAGLWTELCLTLPVLSALEDGYDVYVVVDASGGASEESHRMGIERMSRAGAIPVTWEGVLSELQRDWSRTKTYGPVMEIVHEHAGAWGQGVAYLKAMLHAPVTGG